jgi:hypothetical protein
MKLKLDLHPIFNDSRQIESALLSIIDEAVDKRASEVEIIPGKGSGALKKTVLRFLDRPDIKARYHRIEKDGDNWGRLFVHFRHDRGGSASGTTPVPDPDPIRAACACCGDDITIIDTHDLSDNLHADCPWCGSPNRIVLRRHRTGVSARAELDYSDS